MPGSLVPIGLDTFLHSSSSLEVTHLQAQVLRHSSVSLEALAVTHIFRTFLPLSVVSDVKDHLLPLCFLGPAQGLTKPQAGMEVV